MTYHLRNYIREMKITDRYMKIDLLLWIDAEFECLNIPINDPNQETLFVDKPIAVGYNSRKSIF